MASAEQNIHRRDGVVHTMGNRDYKIRLTEAYGIWDTICGTCHGYEGVLAEPGTFIDRYNASHRTALKKRLVKHWSAFENCLIKWDHADFFGIMNLGVVAPDTEIYLITDEGLMNGCAYQFLRSEFDDFVRWYTSEYKMDFFQSSDYIAFDRELHFVRILHHEGLVFGT